MISTSRLLSVALLFACASAIAAVIDNASVTTLAVVQQTNGNSGPALAISHNGRYAVFVSAASNLLAGDSNRRNDLFLYDAQSDSVEVVSLRADGGQSDAGSIGRAAITDDGRYVFFSSAAQDLVAGGAQGRAQIYVRDRIAATTQLVALAGGLPLDDHLGFHGASADGPPCRNVSSVRSTSALTSGHDSFGRTSPTTCQATRGTLTRTVHSSASAG